MASGKTKGIRKGGREREREREGGSQTRPPRFLGRKRARPFLDRAHLVFDNHRDPLENDRFFYRFIFFLLEEKLEFVLANDTRYVR